MGLWGGAPFKPASSVSKGKRKRGGERGSGEIVASLKGIEREWHHFSLEREEEKERWWRLVTKNGERQR
jgi:hypothetical protein